MKSLSAQGAGGAAVATGGGIELVSPEGGALPVIGAGTGLAMAVGPVAMARLMANPAAVRNLARAIRKGGDAVAPVVSRLIAQANRDHLGDTQLDETIETLREVQNSRFGGFIPTD